MATSTDFSDALSKAAVAEEYAVDDRRVRRPSLRDLMAAQKEQIQRENFAASGNQMVRVGIRVPPS